MDLHTGLSLWRAIESRRVTFPSAAGDLSCEVAVIGGGITGALVSYFLTRQGMDVVLLDKGNPADGSTSASTGLLQYEVDTHLQALIKKVGVDRAVHAYRRGLRAVDELQELTEEIGDSCGYSRRQSLYFAGHPRDVSELQQESECRRHFGLPVQFLSREELAQISSIDAGGALVSSGDAQINPLQFTQGLLQNASVGGLRIFGGSKVEQAKEGNEAVNLTTAAARIHAKFAVVATGYEMELFASKQKANLQSTYVVASEPVESFPGWPNGCLIWETARPYFYARQTDDRRVIIGGADTEYEEDHQRDGLIQKSVGRLLQQFAKLFPSIPLTPAYQWAGTFAETADGLAYIGKPSDKSRTYFALGYGGNGITFSVIAARLIADLLCGRENADAAVFSFER